MSIVKSWKIEKIDFSLRVKSSENLLFHLEPASDRAKLSTLECSHAQHINNGRSLQTIFIIGYTKGESSRNSHTAHNWVESRFGEEREKRKIQFSHVKDSPPPPFLGLFSCVAWCSLRFPIELRASSRELQKPFSPFPYLIIQWLCADLFEQFRVKRENPLKSHEWWAQMIPH